MERFNWGNNKNNVKKDINKMSIFDIFNSLNSSDTRQTGSAEFIIAGLGNIGPKYENTRHNAGFMAAEAIARKYETEIKKMRFKSLTALITVNGKRCILMKPSTYMNNSGEAVAEAMSFYKIPPEKLIVCYDDISLEPGKLRIRRKGSDGGHNGIKSIIALTGSQDFPRVKLGVGAKPNKDYDLASWVLSTFSTEDMKKMNEAAENAVSAVELILNGETDKAMNLYN